MATNRDLLKEAIADAKAVKETAIANAKAALEEAFTPQLKTMFAAKLQEMEKEELEEEGFGKANADSDEGFSQGMDEKALDEAEDEMYEAEDKDMMEIDLEELLRELEEEEGMEDLNEAEEEEEEDMEMSDEESEEGEEEGEPLDLEDMTDEDLKSMIEDVIKDMIEAGELEAGHEGEEGEEEAEEETGMEDEEEVDLAELLKEIEEMEEMEEPIDELFGLGNKEQKIMNQLLDFFSKEGRNIEGASELVKLDPKSDEFKSKVGQILQTQSVTNELGSWAKRTGSSLRGVDVLANFRNALGLKQATKASLGPDSAAGVLGQTNEALEAELAEAMSTIESLKSELNEINLLNAKLLYTNKIFKAKNLNENQKVKVLSSFDKAKTVGEVKMVFETLNEGIKVNKNTIKENLGSASKAMVTPNAKKPIVESNEAFLRMQKLAGLL
jgi:S-DNA-T family DNA segregation ATPase FtsK/SpoIIIE